MEKLVILAVVIFALLIATGPPSEPAAQGPQPAPPPRGEHVTLDRAALLRGAPPDARLWVSDRRASALAGADAALDGTAPTLSVPASSTIVVGTGARVRRLAREDGEHILLPFELRSVGADGAVEDAGQPDVFPVRTSLRWDGAQQAFLCTVRIGLLAQGAPRALASPVTFLLRTTADAVRPSQIDLASTNSYAEIELEDAGNHAEVELLVMPVGMSGEPDEPALTLPVERPALELSVSPSTLQGFGLQTAEVSARPVAGPWSGGAPERLLFAAERGSLAPSDALLGDEGVAKSRLRSSGFGSDTLRAGGAPFAEAEVKVRYVFPTTFVLAALLGGVIGGIAAVRLREKRSVRGADLLTAAATALVAAVAYACGINFTGVDLGRGFHEALVFTVGAVAAIAGLPALVARVARKPA